MSGRAYFHAVRHFLQMFAPQGVQNYCVFWWKSLCKPPNRGNYTSVHICRIEDLRLLVSALGCNLSPCLLSSWTARGLSCSFPLQDESFS